MFVKNNVAMIKLPPISSFKFRPNIFKIPFTAIVSAIEVFRFENGMVLAMVVVWWVLAGVGCERREKRIKTSTLTMKRAVRLAHVMLKYRIIWEVDLLSSMSNDRNMGFPGTKWN